MISIRYHKEDGLWLGRGSFRCVRCSDIVMNKEACYTNEPNVSFVRTRNQNGAAHLNYKSTQRVALATEKVKVIYA